ncbi:MAG: DUF2442 domain-containing protein [Clostridia bacterium]|nr:DUF2442 domain-containing protein [Clostridia bacterium]
MFHKVKSVKAISKYVLKVTFQNNIIKYYDVSILFNKWKAFENLKEIEGLFEMVKVDQGGYGIIWNDEIDLGCEELWKNGVDKAK